MPLSWADQSAAVVVVVLVVVVEVAMVVVVVLDVEAIVVVEVSMTGLVVVLVSGLLAVWQPVKMTSAARQKITIMNGQILILIKFYALPSKNQAPLTPAAIKPKITAASMMIKRSAFIVFLLILCAAAVSAMGGSPPKGASYMIEQQGELAITSPAFKDQGYIPDKYTCKGADVNPPLVFENVPAGTKSLVLIFDDPDAPMGTWDHWIVFNIPPGVKEIKENEAPEGSVLGTNSFRKLEYGGPCPPPGKPHHYVFELYALDTTLDLKQGARKKEVEQAMNGHLLGQTSLVGLFKR